MAEEKEKAIGKDHETIKPAGSKKPEDEISEEDLKTVAGGEAPTEIKHSSH